MTTLSDAVRPIMAEWELDPIYGECEVCDGGTDPDGSGVICGTPWKLVTRDVMISDDTSQGVHICVLCAAAGHGLEDA